MIGKLLPLFFLFFLALSSTQAQRHIPRTDQIDVLQYVFELQLSDESDAIRGTATVAVRFLKPLDSFQLDLTKKDALSGKGMLVSKLEEDGRAVSFSQEKETLTIQLNESAAKGAIRTYRIEYQGIPADGLIISKNKYGQRTFFGDNWPDRAHNWLPTVDHPSDKATVEFIVTAPEHYQVVANGFQLEETNLKDNLKLTHWKEDTPLPTKVMVIGAARFGVQLAGEVEGTLVSSWVYPQDRKAGFYDYSQAKEVLQFFVENIGDYPFEKLANVQSKTRYGGMENAGNIFYFENSVTGDRSHEDLLAHEIAHQWFGDSASEKNWFHIWLSEGFATYLADLYIENKYGKTKFRRRLKKEREKALEFAKQKQTPVIDTTILDYNQLLNPNSYQKGGWVLHMLRRKVGEENFWKGIQGYYRKFRDGNALTEDFRKVMEEVSGTDLKAFFQQWLYRPGNPILEVGWKRKTDGSLHLSVKQIQEGEAFRFPLDVEAVNETAKQSQRWTIDVDSKESEFELKCEFVPSRIILDPDTQLLFSGEVTESRKD